MRGNQSTADERRRARVWAKRRRAALQARGLCVCGRRIAPGSRSRCLACLEQARRDQRRRTGTTTVRPNGKGRPILGAWRDRKRAFERDAALRDRPRDGG